MVVNLALAFFFTSNYFQPFMYTTYTILHFFHLPHSLIPFNIPHTIHFYLHALSAYVMIALLILTTLNNRPVSSMKSSLTNRNLSYLRTDLTWFLARHSICVSLQETQQLRKKWSILIAPVS